jgi:hypothetical protein
MNRDVPPGMPGFAYNPSADVRGWQTMHNFFREIFGV